MASAKFLKLNDDSGKDNPGVWNNICGSSCTRHTMKLNSHVAQNIFLTAFTWGDRGIPEECIAKDNELFHTLVVSKLDNVFVWNFGDFQL